MRNTKNRVLGVVISAMAMIVWVYAMIKGSVHPAVILALIYLWVRAELSDWHSRYLGDVQVQINELVQKRFDHLTALSLEKIVDHGVSKSNPQ